ncbi:hypothetical protein RJT34_11577 [Clitoria ternatea]|uniref:Uncharacterized protein n=1 Tax=Clitoria ternatea TaxID=43366 RepID=A0AAN9JKS5_CLITE
MPQMVVKRGAYLVFWFLAVLKKINCRGGDGDRDGVNEVARMENSNLIGDGFGVDFLVPGGCQGWFWGVKGGKALATLASSCCHPIFGSGHIEFEMSVTETTKKNGAPQIVKLDKALKLAESWVNNMSRDADDERTDTDIVDRPYRLGLGAKVSRQSKVGPSDDPIERKLYAKLNAGKRKAANIAKRSTTITRDVLDDENDYEDEDSRTSAFAKRKATVPLTSSTLGNQKQK